MALEGESFYQKIAGQVKQAGGRLYMVGGRVRDHHLLGTRLYPDTSSATPQDVDLVAAGLDLATIASILAPFGSALSVGRRGTVGGSREPSLVHLRRGSQVLEISPARRRGLAGEIEFHQEADLTEDAQTRDFRLNAIYFDILEQNFEDPLGGLNDARAGWLSLAHRLAFSDDPLRMLRAMNFVSRFKLKPSEELLASAAANVSLLGLVPPDRFWPEWKKWALSSWPHLGLEYLHDSGLLAHWPALTALTLTPQNPRFHPEGNAWLHTVLVVKAMSELGPPRTGRRVLLTLAALLHDIGKPLVTRVENGVLISRGHAQAGSQLSAEFLGSIRAPADLLKPLTKLVERHMDTAFQELTPRALRRLARRLAPHCGLTEFWALAASDWNGRGEGFEKYPYGLEQFLEPLNGRDAPIEPLLKGRDLLEAFDLKPGPQIGRVLKLIEAATDDGLIGDRAGALAYARRIIEEDREV